MKEEILVVEAGTIKELLAGKPGLKKIEKERIFKLIEKNGQFKEREEVEHDASFKQIIPYIAMYNDADEILTLRRLKTQSEKRLHNKLSIGVGGHVNLDDSNIPLEAFKQGMRREIAEEVTVDLIENPEFMGIIYDGSTDVGQVHLGMAYKVRIVFHGINEADKFEYFWNSPEELKAHVDDMETWSAFLLKELKMPSQV